MRETLSFAAWLAAAPQSWFLRIARTRTDLLRTDAPDVRRLAALAASRTAAAAGLEMLSADALRVVHRAAVQSRISPAVPREKLPAPSPASGAGTASGAEASAPASAQDRTAPEPAGLARAVEAGLLWPAFPPEASSTGSAAKSASAAGASSEDSWPLTAAAYRVHPEVPALLPMTAASRADGLAWDSARDPRPLTTDSVSASLLLNAQAAGAAGAVSRALDATAEFARHEISQLVSGGVGKRDAQTLARAVDLSPGRLILTVELAHRLGWLSVSTDPSDPVWLPTPAYDSAAATAREEIWAQLVWAWLTHPVDVVHVLAGTTPAGERVHLLGRDDHSRSAFPGFPVAAPQILRLRRLVLSALLHAGEPGTAVQQEELLALLVWEHPLLAVLTEEELAQVLDETESFGLTASPLGRARSHALTPLGRALATWLEERAHTAHEPEDPDAATPLPASLLAEVAALLPPLESTVTLQSDLTAVAAGPLEHTAQTRLEALAEIDTRGQGTVFRITDDSIAAALRAGRDAPSLLQDLTELSSTGVPSTLTHMIESQASRLNRVRVAAARSVIVVDDPADLDVIFDDPASAATGMRRLSPTVAVSPAPADRVTALVETEDRPVLRADTEAESGRPDRAPVPVRPAPPVTRTTRVPADRVEEHIDRLERTRSAAASRSGAAAGRAGKGRAGEGRTSGTGASGAGASGGAAARGDGDARGAGTTARGDGARGGAGRGSGTGGAGAAGQATRSRGATGAGAAGQGAATSVPGGNAAAVSAVGAEAGTAGVLAELSEAAAVKAEVELIAAGSDGSLRRIRMLPGGVRAGRVLGRTSAGTAVRIAASRVVEVRRV
jgi:hypothetical protein